MRTQTAWHVWTHHVSREHVFFLPAHVMHGFLCYELSFFLPCRGRGACGVWGHRAGELSTAVRVSNSEWFVWETQITAFTDPPNLNQEIVGVGVIPCLVPNRPIPPPAPTSTQKHRENIQANFSNVMLSSIKSILAESCGIRNMIETFNQHCWVVVRNDKRYVKEIHMG